MNHSPARPTSRPIVAPTASSTTSSSTIVRTPASGPWIISIRPITRITAIGSLKPASPSSVIASLRRSVEPLSTEKTAAASVEAITAPSRKPSRVDTSSSRTARAPVIAAVSTVPTVASESEGPITGRIAENPVVRPPSNRISARAMIPISWASSKSSKSIRPSPSVPISIPTPMKMTSAGIRIRWASRVRVRLPSTSTPAIRMKPVSTIR